MYGRLPVGLLGAALISSLFVAPAHAQRARVFVASYGSDSASCGGFLAPCRNFQQAVNNVLAGGEVTAIDSAGFGSLTINKGVSITSPNGVEAGVVTVSGGTGITINAPAGAAVNLQGLTIDGANGGSYGIVFSSGGSLTIKNSVIRNFANSGIGLAPTVASTIEVTDTLVANNAGDGIYLQPVGGVNMKVYAVFNRVEAYKNGQIGIAVLGNLNFDTRASAIDCVSAHNGIDYESLGQTSANTVFRIFRSSATNANIGVHADTNGVVVVSQSQLEDNVVNWDAINNGVVYTYGDNYTDGASVPASGAAISKH
jgi:hypothetical protein